MPSISISPSDIEALGVIEGVVAHAHEESRKRSWERRRSSDSELMELELNGGNKFNRFKRRRAVGIIDNMSRDSALLSSPLHVFTDYSMTSNLSILSTNPALLPSPDFKFPLCPTTSSPELPTIALPVHKSLHPRIRSTSLPILLTANQLQYATKRWDSARILSLHLAQSNDTQLLSPTMAPPISIKTLRGLDLDQILRNSQLRHDIFFEANLILSSPLENRKDW